MVKDHAVFAARQQASEQMRALLVSLDQAFPPAPPVPNEAFMAAAKLRREQSIEKLLPLIDLREPKLDGDSLHQSIDAFTPVDDATCVAYQQGFSDQQGVDQSYRSPR